MIRCLSAAVIALATTVSGLGCASTAAAAPSSDGANPPSCVYTLSTPQVVQVSSATMVTVRLSPYPCTGSITPNSLTVCLTPQGRPTAGQCGFSSIPTYAEVFVPYKAGTTYVASGTGCGDLYTTQGAICASVGPTAVTL